MDYKDSLTRPRLAYSQIVAAKQFENHVDVTKWNIFHITGASNEEFTGYPWISITMASNVEL